MDEILRGAIELSKARKESCVSPEIVTQLKERIVVLETSGNFFSDVLNSQLVTYSTIVAILVAVALGLYFLFIPKITKRKIEEVVKLEMENVMQEIGKETDSEIKKLKETQLDNENRINYLEGEAARSLALLSENAGSHKLALNWWLNASISFSKTKYNKLTNIALDATIKEVDHVSKNKIVIDTAIMRAYLKTIDTIKKDEFKEKIKKLEEKMSFIIPKES
jgi:hypothetical protein